MLNFIPINKNLNVSFQIRDILYIGLNILVFGIFIVILLLSYIAFTCCSINSNLKSINKTITIQNTVITKHVKQHSTIMGLLQDSQSTIQYNQTNINNLLKENEQELSQMETIAKHCKVIRYRTYHLLKKLKSCK